LELLGGSVTALRALKALLVDRGIPIAVKVLEKQVGRIILSQQRAVESHFLVLALR